VDKHNDISERVRGLGNPGLYFDTDHHSPINAEISSFSFGFHNSRIRRLNTHNNSIRHPRLSITHISSSHVECFIRAGVAIDSSSKFATHDNAESNVFCRTPLFQSSDLIDPESTLPKSPDFCSLFSNLHKDIDGGETFLYLETTLFGLYDSNGKSGF
jgi:hypothetical protein